MSLESSSKGGEFMALYKLLVPEVNVFRKMNEDVDFTFIKAELRDKYDIDKISYKYGLATLCKYLIAKSYMKLSDADFLEEADKDMSIRMFFMVSPEEDLMDLETLKEFRTQVVKDDKLYYLLHDKVKEIADKKGFNLNNLLYNTADMDENLITLVEEETEDLLNMAINDGLVSQEMYDLFDQTCIKVENSEESLEYLVDFTKSLIEIITENEVNIRNIDIIDRVNYLNEFFTNGLTFSKEGPVITLMVPSIMFTDSLVKIFS